MPAAKKTTATKKPRAAASAKQVLGSRVRITLDDSRGKETLTLETPGGQVIKLNDARHSIEITDGSGNTIKLDPAGITINAAAKVTVNASEVKVNAGALMVETGVARFTGVVQCDRLISNSVVSSSYTPGAGNIM
jgi:hypothetical protein